MDPVYSTAITKEEARAFQMETQEALGISGLSFEEVTIGHLVNVQVGDVNNNPASPFECLVFEFCGDDNRNAAAPFGPRASSLIRRTKSPILDGSNKIPGALALGIFAVAAQVRIADDAAVASNASINFGEQVQKTLDQSVIQLVQGGSRIYEARGPEFMNYGPGQRVDSATIGATASLINSPTGQLKGRKLLPVVLGVEQELTLSHFWDRTTAADPAEADPWPAAFQIQYWQVGLIARKR